VRAFESQHDEETNMPEHPFIQANVDVLTQWDTPTIRNELEIALPERHATGFTAEPMVHVAPNAKPTTGSPRRHV
jgi:hypothetical protein